MPPNDGGPERAGHGVLTPVAGLCRRPSAASDSTTKDTMSSTEAPPVATGEHEQEADPSCTVCPHAWSGHDALGRRFCTATHDVGWSRGCICPAPMPRSG